MQRGDHRAAAAGYRHALRAKRAALTPGAARASADIALTLHNLALARCAVLASRRARESF